MTKTEAERKAQAMMDQIKAGKTIFTKAHEEWMVIGPADTLTVGGIVTATRQNGETTQVSILQVHTTATRQGVTYSTATFQNVVVAEPKATNSDAHRIVQSATFGPGKRYASQPGATQYDSDGSGRFSTQIWDNA